MKNGDDTVDEECRKSGYINPETEVQQGCLVTQQLSERPMLPHTIQRILLRVKAAVNKSS